MNTDCRLFLPSFGPVQRQGGAGGAWFTQSQLGKATMGKQN